MNFRWNIVNELIVSLSELLLLHALWPQCYVWANQTEEFSSRDLICFP